MSGVMNPKLNWPIAMVLGMLAPFALPAGVTETAVALIEDLHIAEFAVAANALTTVF